MSLRGSFAPKKASEATVPSSRAGGAASGARLNASSSSKKAAATAAAPRTPTCTVRRATSEDAIAIQALYQDASLVQREHLIRAFGQQASIPTLLASSLLSLVVESGEPGQSHGRVIGFAAFGDDAPHYFMRLVGEGAAQANAASRASATAAQKTTGVGASTTERVDTDWSEYLRVHYNTHTDTLLSSGTEGGLTTYNTAWLRYFLLAEDKLATYGACERVLRTLFTTLTHIDQVVATIPSGVDAFAPLTDHAHFDELHVRHEVANSASSNTLAELQSVRVFAAPRAWVVPNLLLRRARIEDNDDLVPICNAQSAILTEVYGEFYLATLIQSQNAHQHALVAEVDGRARGLAGITDQVDVKLLQECFDLEEYEQLRKAPTPEEEAEARSQTPTPVTRMNNIFRTIVANPAPLTAAEKLAQQQQALQGGATPGISKRGTLAKRGTLGSGGFGAIAGMLKTDPAAAANVTTGSTNSGSPAQTTGGPTINVSLSPAVSGHSLVTPTGSSGSGATSTRNSDYPELIRTPTNASALVAAAAGMTPTGTSNDASLPPTTFIQIEPATSFPAQWLLTYLETFRPETMQINAANEAREQREAGEEAQEPDDATLENEEAVLANVAQVAAKFQQTLASSSITTFDNQSFNDVVVATLPELDGLSTGGLLRLLELAVRVPANMPVRPPPPAPLDASIDDGTAKDNVFCITLFCLDAAYEARSIDVLRAVFQLYPDRAYCVLTLPHTSPPASVKLLEYFTYVRPTARNTFGHALYLVHRDTVATINQLQVHAPTLQRVPEPSASKALVAASLEENTERVLASVQPLIAHLSYADTLQREISAAITHAHAQHRAKADGTDLLRLKPQSTYGLSGKELAAKRAAIEIQLLESKTSPYEVLLVSCQGSLVGLVLFNRLSQEEVDLLRADFDVEAFVDLADLPPPAPMSSTGGAAASAHEKALQPAANPYDPAAPLPSPLEDLYRSIHLNIVAFVLNPLWNTQVAFICREMMRLKKAHVLYYQVWSKPSTTPTNTVPKALSSLSPASGLNAAYRFAGEVASTDADGEPLLLPQLIDAFVQVRPRRRPTMVGKDGQIQVHTPLPCALHVLSRRLIAEPKAVINTRLVIVGASTTALAFLEHLLLQPDKQYASVTLLSKDGLQPDSSSATDADPTLLIDEDAAPHFLPTQPHAYSAAYLARLHFTSRIRVVRRTLVDLRAGDKTLLLDDGTRLPYDVLVLTPGLQNQLPVALIRAITAAALADELRAKAELQARHSELVRDARRRKKAQEQGLEDASGLDAEGLAKLDEELEREAQQRAKERAEAEGGAHEDGADDDEDLESVASYDSKGKSVRRKRAPGGGAGGRRAGALTAGGSSDKPSHSDWKKWVAWSSSGLEHWDAEYGTLLAKQRALDQGTLDPTAALEANARARAWAHVGFDAAGNLVDDLAIGAAADAFDPATMLDLTPYGVRGLYAVSAEEHVAKLVRQFRTAPDVHRKGAWLVNGASLDALTSIQGLLELGVPAKNITWIHPLRADRQQQQQQNTYHYSGATNNSNSTPAYGPSSVAFLNRGGSASSAAEDTDEDDPLILPRILSTLIGLGVQVHAGKMIKAVKQTEGRVHAVTLVDVPPPASSSETNMQTKHSTAFWQEEKELQQAGGTPTSEETGMMELHDIVGVIGCGALDVDPYIFKALHGSSLVYDGRLVLNHAFQTTVPTIYAGGPLAKFSRAYGTQVLPLEQYDARELGQQLADAVLKTALDAHNASSVEAAKKAKAKQPLASKLPALGAQPKVTQALLPGSLLYFHAATPTHRTMAQPKVLITSNDARIVRLVFNDYNVLASLTVLASAPASTDSAALSQFLATSSATHQNLVRLIGMPASYMNRILFRYQQKQIPDLVDFLTGPWSSALYHESFSQLRAFLHYFLHEKRLEIVAILDRIIQLFTTQEQQKAPSLVEDGEVTATNEVDPSGVGQVDPFLVSQLASLLPASLKDVVQRALLRFLRVHENHLPAYATPKPFYPGTLAKPMPAQPNLAAAQ